MGGNTIPACIADPAPLTSYVVTMMPGDAADATELRKPETWQTQGLAGSIREALPPGNVNVISPSILMYEIVKAP